MQVVFGRKARDLESIIAITDMSIDGFETEYRQEVSESARENVSGTKCPPMNYFGIYGPHHQPIKQSNEQQVRAHTEQERTTESTKNSERELEEVEETKGVEFPEKQVKFSARDQSIIPPPKYHDADMAEVEEIEKTLLELHVSDACCSSSGFPNVMNFMKKLKLKRLMFSGES